jgi:hypothetical protein
MLSLAGQDAVPSSVLTASIAAFSRMYFVELHQKWNQQMTTSPPSQKKPGKVLSMNI